MNIMKNYKIKDFETLNKEYAQTLVYVYSKEAFSKKDWKLIQEKVKDILSDIQV